MSAKYTPEVAEYIAAHCTGVSPTTMAGLVNSEFGTDYTPNQIKVFYQNHHLRSGLDGRYKPGHVPVNAGRKGWHAPGSERSWFPPGHVPHTVLPVGTVKLKSDGYLWKKIAEVPNAGNRNWRQLHVLVWEEAHGPIPPGQIIIFRDNNRQNCALENLMMISRADNAVLNRWVARPENPEFLDAALTVARILKRRSELKHRRGKNET